MNIAPPVMFLTSLRYFYLIPLRLQYFSHTPYCEIGRTLPPELYIYIYHSSQAAISFSTVLKIRAYFYNL